MHISYVLKHNTHALKATEKYLADVGVLVSDKCIRSDIGTGFVNKHFEAFLIRNMIKHEHSDSYSPHQNGVFDVARCLLVI